MLHNLSRVLSWVNCFIFKRFLSVDKQSSGQDECLEAAERLSQAGVAQAQQQQPDQPWHWWFPVCRP